MGDDRNRSLEFCEWTRLKMNANENFYKQIVFSDEADIHVNGTVIEYNLLCWSVNNHYKARKIPGLIVSDPVDHFKVQDLGPIDCNTDLQTMNVER